MINKDLEEEAIGSLKICTRFWRELKENGKLINVIKGRTKGKEEGTGNIKVEWDKPYHLSQPHSLPANTKVEYDPNEQTGSQSVLL